eukprot:gene7744-919_t
MSGRVYVAPAWTLRVYVDPAWTQSRQATTGKPPMHPGCLLFNFPLVMESVARHAVRLAWRSKSPWHALTMQHAVPCGATNLDPPPTTYPHPQSQAPAARFCSSVPLSATSKTNSDKSWESNPVCARYLALVKSGSLQHDPQQWTVVTRLATLFNEVEAHQTEMVTYTVSLEEYKVRRDKIFKQLEVEDALQLKKDQEAASARMTETEQGKQGGSWMSWLPFGKRSAPDSKGEQKKELTPEQKARMAASRRQTRAMQKAGPAPSPPPPPRGL